ncbi:MAG: sensor histidine kinase [Sphingobacteriales bacterium]|nr:sensor histidine kinase [Sphingobacteriales bacterium]
MDNGKAQSFICRMADKEVYYCMKKELCCCLFFLLLLSSARTQQRLVDSLTKELQQSMPDSNRATSMMRLAVDYEAVDTAKAYQAYREAIKFASEKKLYYQLGRVYQNQSFLFNSAANYEQALASLDHAIENYKKSGHPKAKLWEANAYNDKANSLKAKNEFQQAIEYYLKSISVIEEHKLPGGLVGKYTNLSTVFGDINEDDKQTEYAHKAVTAAKNGGSRQDRFMAYFILANAYSKQDSNRSAKMALDSSKIHFAEEDNVDNIDILLSYHLVSAQVFKKLAQLDSALYFLQKAYDISKAYNYSYGKAESELQMGAITIMKKNYVAAEKYLLSGIKEAESVNYYGMLNDGYKYLSDVYAVTGRYKEAYEYFQKHKQVNDSVVNMESKKYGKELEKKYETAKKDAQLLVQHSEIERKSKLNYILITGAVMLLAISLLLHRNYRQKQKLQQQRINELETEKQLTAVEAVLKGEEQERTRLSKDLHDGLGGMLSGIKYSFQTMKGNLVMTSENAQVFERSMDMLDSSIKEMRRVAHNMMPEALVKFGLDIALQDFCQGINQSGALQVNYQSIGIDKVDIEQTTAITIYRIVQELINNTMKHASAKTAIIQLSAIDNGIGITVEDDGKGFNPAILERSGGMGWSNIRSRIEYLKGKVDVQSERGKGASVHIELNV